MYLRRSSTNKLAIRIIHLTPGHAKIRNQQSVFVAHRNCSMPKILKVTIEILPFQVFLWMSSMKSTTIRTK